MVCIALKIHFHFSEAMLSGSLPGTGYLKNI